MFVSNCIHAWLASEINILLIYINNPAAINKRLSALSSNENMFESVAPIFRDALKNAGYLYLYTCIISILCNFSCVQPCIPAHIHTCLLSRLNTCKLLYIHSCILAYLRTYIYSHYHSCISGCLTTCILTCIFTGIRSYLNTFTHA